MIGLLVQVTAEFAKIWSTSSHRLITYSINELPINSHEGDWINIEFDSNGILQSITKTRDLLETRRDERGKMQVLDRFIVSSNQKEARSETFGVVRMENGKEGEKWNEEGKINDHSLLVWMTISSNALFSIEEQSVKSDSSNDKKHSMEALRVNKSSDDYVKRTDCLMETILIVGFSPNSECFFAASHSGESIVPPAAWKKHEEVKLGDVFVATLQPARDDISRGQLRVVNLERRKEVWDGVEVNVSGNDVRIVVEGKIVERRSSCFVLDTIPFGLITYPINLGLSSVPENVEIGEYLRVRINRFRQAKSDYPSKFQVTSLMRRIPPPVPPVYIDSSIEEGDNWVEGIVTCISALRVFISFKHGNAYVRNLHIDIRLSLGTVVDMLVRKTGSESLFEVCDIDNRTRSREDITVEKQEEGGREIFTVSCAAEVMERRDGYFLLDTPIIGTVVVFFRKCPKRMKIGETWNVKMHRRKEKRDFPSHWVAHEVVGDSPISNTNEKRKINEGKSMKDENIEEDKQWRTVIVTGVNGGDWYGSSSLSDTVLIPYSIVGKLEVPQRGDFYRIKCSKQSDLWKAYEVNPKQVHPKGFDIVKGKGGLQVWCYASIESRQSDSFTLFNELLGEATLPHKFTHSNMRVGDEIEALYYRVKNTSNSTHWMVQQVGEISSEKSMRKEGMKMSYDGNEEWRMGEDGRDYSEGEICSVTTTKYPREMRKQKDRRVLNAMHFFLSQPEIHEILMIGNKEEFQIIEKILERDRMKFDR